MVNLEKQTTQHINEILENKEQNDETADFEGDPLEFVN